jgi:hypothetical protein
MEWLALFFGWVFYGHGAVAGRSLPSLDSASANEIKGVALPLGACAGRSMSPRLALQIEIQGVALVVLRWLVHQDKGVL